MGTWFIWNLNIYKIVSIRSYQTVWFKITWPDSTIHRLEWLLLYFELNLGELVELELKQRTLSHSVSFSFPTSFMAALRPLCLSAFYHTSDIWLRSCRIWSRGWLNEHNSNKEPSHTQFLFPSQPYSWRLLGLSVSLHLHSSHSHSLCFRCWVAFDED